ncbi:hypothetical protein [Polynucleobacter sp. AP-Kolm-20A-A1]|uniref:hypothetical protein n=1 Tax=Polynucleobacter sp. AP-Kolm-20A-A1 TaxID=2081041 RepID=UPI002040BAC2|nr:hypothetical protein [Polynucleobacter sp. AP-Kolm-20A-A1]
MKPLHLSLCSASFLLSASALAQTPINQGMQTFSPYSAEQISEFNHQVISPVEGPFGPVAPNTQGMNLRQRPTLDSKLYNNPEGEDEAEALETQSAEPYQPSSPVMSF